MEPFDNLPAYQQLGFIAGCAERGLRELSRFRKLIRANSSALRPATTFLWQSIPIVGQLSTNDPVLADHIKQVGLVHDLTAPDRDTSYPQRVLNDVAGIILSGLGLLRDPGRRRVPVRGPGSSPDVEPRWFGGDGRPAGGGPRRSGQRGSRRSERREAAEQGGDASEVPALFATLQPGEWDDPSTPDDAARWAAVDR